MQYTIHYNGFHGRSTLRVRGELSATPANLPVTEAIEVSARVARRLNRAVCGLSDCQCGEQVAVEDMPYSGRWWVVLPDEGEEEIRGNYPQS